MDDKYTDIMNACPDPSPAVLLRLEADGELPEQWRPLLEQYLDSDPQAAARLDFERSLRERVAAVTPAVTAPPELADKIREMFRSEADTAVATEPDLRLTGSSTETERKESFSTGRRLTFPRLLSRLAVAAVFALLVGVVGYVALTGQNRNNSGIKTPGTVPLTQASHKLFNFIDERSTACSDFTDFFDDNNSASALNQIPDVLSPHLGCCPPVIDLSSCGFTFRGAGACHVPYYGPSLHYVYSAGDNPGEGVLSIFVQHVTESTDMQPGVLYQLVREGSKRTILAWLEDDKIIYLVPPEGQSAADVVKLLNAPSERRTIPS
ncbi:MAG TPA: hypothetical protein ENJ06_01730 [Phycisphaeraceae bacterium]|nr:hypothetical protein [Phycisphaeraceae bacterium]